MTARLEEFLCPSIFLKKQKRNTPSHAAAFSYESELEELVDLAGQEFSTQILKRALIAKKGDIDEAYDLLLSGDQISLAVEEEKAPETEIKFQSKISVILYLLRNIAHTEEVKIEEIPVLALEKQNEQISFNAFSEKAWFDGKSALVANREKKPIMKEVKIWNYNYFRKRSKV